eukprot:12368640-Alexandrium_andersonii.AAC.1
MQEKTQLVVDYVRNNRTLEELGEYLVKLARAFQDKRQILCRSKSSNICCWYLGTLQKIHAKLRGETGDGAGTPAAAS